MAPIAPVRPQIVFCVKLPSLTRTVLLLSLFSVYIEEASAFALGPHMLHNTKWDVFHHTDRDDLGAEQSSFSQGRVYAVRRKSRHAVTEKNEEAGDNGCSDIEEGNFAEMEKTILSLSKEETDLARRQRLATLFAENLSCGDENSLNEAAADFVKLFDQALAKVGSEIQLVARERALAKRRAELEEMDVEDDKDDVDASPDSEKIGSNFKERQLWACVDMMVQSKTIVKRMTQT